MMDYLVCQQECVGGRKGSQASTLLENPSASFDQNGPAFNHSRETAGCFRHVQAALGTRILYMLTPL